MSIRPWGASGPALAIADDVEEGDVACIAELLGKCNRDTFSGERIDVRCLLGGANNRNYTAEDGGRKVVVRIANSFSERFSIDRVSALQAQRDAAGAGLAPRLLAAKLPEGHAVSEFLEGETLRDDTIAEDWAVAAVGRALRKLHETKSSCRRSSAFEEIRAWIEWAHRDGVDLPADLEALLEATDRVEQLGFELDLPIVFCHNDTVPQNFLRGPGESVLLVDWDFAGNAWASFEIASFIAVARLDERQREILLEAYAGGATEGQLATLELLGFVGAVRELSWALMAAPVLSGATTLFEGWSYERHRDTYLEEARRRFAEPGFEALFGLARQGGGRAW